uniref:ShKT domain-containing protein n=1 Tax=Pinctada fucata TaxID=50426 RepID=A0A194ANT7_PINFU
MLSVCLCVIGLSYWTAAEHVTVTPEYKKLFIDTHNKIRREVGSSNMQYLEWDDNLAAEAADWASRCHFYHKNGQGENLAYNTNKMTEVELIKDAMNMWYEEKNDYSYNSLSCSGICSHYTNLVWAITTKFGCGMEKCHNGLGFYTVCFYRPVGNWVGQYPYLTGDACSRCNPGQHCENKLCRGVSTKNVSTGIGPHGDCADDPQKASQCPGWKFSCESNRGFMETHCPKTCNFCSASSSSSSSSTHSHQGSGHAGHSVTTSHGTGHHHVTSTTSKNCEDDVQYRSRCEGWKWSCQKNRGFMEPHCPKTCGFCSDGTATMSTACDDSAKYRSRCGGWTWSCDSNASFMHLYCRKSCGLCN